MLAALVCLGAAACTSPSGNGSAPSAGPSSTPASASTSAGPVTLRFAVYGDAPVLAAYRKLAATWNADHPDITVKLETSHDAVTSEDKVDRGFDAGTPPDLFLTRQTSLPELKADDRVQPVDELLEQRGVQFGDSYQRIGLEAFAGDAALQCMPNEVSPYVVFYNKRLLVPRRFGEPAVRRQDRCVAVHREAQGDRTRARGLRRRGGRRARGRCRAVARRSRAPGSTEADQGGQQRRDQTEAAVPS